MTADGLSHCMRSGPRSPVQITRQQTAAALTSLVKNNAKAQIAVASKGGIEPLIKIISAQVNGVLCSVSKLSAGKQVVCLMAFDWPLITSKCH